jgi:hypothetical protein
MYKSSPARIDGFEDVSVKGRSAPGFELISQGDPRSALPTWIGKVRRIRKNPS